MAVILGESLKCGQYEKPAEVGVCHMRLPTATMCPRIKPVHLKRWLWSAAFVVSAICIYALISRFQFIGGSQTAAERVQRLSGLKLPSSSKVDYERDTHGGFLNQGVRLREIAVDSRKTSGWLTDCPSPFERALLTKTPIWPQIADRSDNEREFVCVMVDSTATHEDVIVIGAGRVIFIEADR